MKARDILGLRRDFTPDQLRANFRALALHLHPDKTSLPPAEANALFQRLIAAYNELRDPDAHAAASARRLGGGVGESSARQFDDLRNSHRPNESGTQVDEHLRSAAAASLGGGGRTTHGGGGTTSTNPMSKFDIHRFNTVFNRTRMPDASTDDGYTDWMNTVSPEEVAAQHTQQQGVQKYIEPEALVSCRGLQYTEIGQGRTRDYGRGSATVGQGHSLRFSDYRSAHSTDSRVIDPATARPRASFATMLEIENARSAQSEPLTVEEQRGLASRERQVADAEARRLRTLRRQDVSGRHHQAAVTAALLALES